jgi:hypothetical protein
MHYLKLGVSVTDKIIVPLSLRVLNRIAKHYSVTVVGIVLFNVCSLFTSIILKDFDWLAASGGVTTIFGVLLTVSHSVPKTDEEVQYYVASIFPKSGDGIMSELPTARGVNLSIPEVSEDNEALMKNTAKKVLKIESIGVTLTIIGTLLWAYSGFLTNFIYPYKCLTSC